MSAIFGCVSLDGRPVPPGTGEAMGEALARWGPDGVTWSCRPGAVLGQARLSITPESAYESLPEWNEAGGGLFTAAARLDNREELCERMGISPGEGATLADGTLAGIACRKWGDEAPRYLLGDWAFADWDERKRTLRLSRDQLGNTGLYYLYRPPWFAFASDPQGIFALDWAEREVNELKIASYLVVFPLVGEEETCWKGILKLLPGSSLRVGPEELVTRRYWDMSLAPVMPRLRDDEYVAGFLERFRVAVKSRLRSRFPVGVLLSAGLDSGAVTALASQALGDEGGRLTALTSVPLFPAGHLAKRVLTDEWPLARAVTRRYPHVDHLAIDAATVSPLAGIARAVAIHHAPQHAAANEFWLMALHEKARELGIGVMLTGQLGNGGVSWSGGRDRIFCLFAAGRWDEGLKAMAQWRRKNHGSWIRTVAECLAKPMLRPAWSFARSRSLFSPAWSEFAAIHPAFASRLQLGEAMRSGGSAGSFTGVMDPIEERRLTLARNGVMAGPIWHALGAAFNLEVRDPTADVRLLEYCLGVPDEQVVLGGGQRMLIRRAMEGILPPEVQWNTVRGRQAADVALRLLENRAEMEATLARLERNGEATSCLDLRLMRRVWNELDGKVTPRTSYRAVTILMRGIMCGCFLEDAGSSKKG